MDAITNFKDFGPNPTHHSGMKNVQMVALPDIIKCDILNVWQYIAETGTL
jgi:hypothetical protein